MSVFFAFFILFNFKSLPQATLWLLTNTGSCLVMHSNAGERVSYKQQQCLIEEDDKFTLFIAFLFGYCLPKAMPFSSPKSNFRCWRFTPTYEHTTDTLQMPNSITNTRAWIRNSRWYTRLRPSPYNECIICVLYESVRLCNVSQYHTNCLFTVLILKANLTNTWWVEPLGYFWSIRD